jgi:hypothetical protein
MGFYCPRTQSEFGNSMDVVEFWREEDAMGVEKAVHCAQEGQNIAAQMYQPKKAVFGDYGLAFVPLESLSLHSRC